MIKTVLLGDLINIKSGKARPKKTGDYPVYGGNGIFDSAPTFNINEPAVIVGRVGAYCGSVYIEKKPFWLSDNALGVTVKDEVNLDFVFYLLKSLELNNKSIGGAQPLITQGILNRISVTVPSLEVQMKIAEILGSIDEKIELNRKMNETLEQMGQALFKKYFITNPAAEKWKKRPLGDFVSLVNGASYKSSELKASSNALVTLKSVGRGGGFSRRGFKEYIGKIKDSQIVVDGDLIVAHTDLTQKAEVAGYPAIVDGADQYDNVAISMDLVKVVPNNNGISTSLVYFLLKTRDFQDYKIGYISGSTVLHLNKKCIPGYEIALPSAVEVLKDLSLRFDMLIKKIKENNQEIQTLTTLRDSLLPRLISGKIKLD
jgi:type I restriction enzyme S subunit